MNLRHLDVLRACLALMVLIGHARMMLWIGWQNWKVLPHEAWEKVIAVVFSVFRYGHEAVIVFFALSGFFIHLRPALARARGSVEAFSTSGYLRRRARRILPPYYAALIFTVVLDVAGRHWWPRLYLAQTGDALLDSNFTDAGYNAAAVVPALFAQPSLMGIRFGGNAPLWSIGSEVFYYALYPLFMALWQRSRALGYAVGMGAGAAAWWWPWAGWWNGAMGYYPIWLMGALMAEVLCALPDRRHSAYSFACGALLAAATFALSHLGLIRAHPWLSVPVFMAMGAAVILMVERLPLDLMRFRLGRGLEWLGIRSYSLYIFHFPALVLLSAWCIQTFGERPSHGWLAVAGVALSLGTGLLGFHLVEQRFLPKRLQAP